MRQPAEARAHAASIRIKAIALESGISQLRHDDASDLSRRTPQRPAIRWREFTMTARVCYYLGTFEDWGGASRALLNFVVRIDRRKFEPLVVVTQSGKLVNTLAAKGIESAIRPKHDWDGNPFRYALNVARSAAFLLRRRVDLVHMNIGSLGWKPPEVLAARLLRIPVVMHFHMVDPEPTPFIKYAKQIVAVSQYVARHSGFGTRHVAAIHNISDLERFTRGRSIRDELGLACGDLVVGFLGHVKRLKGIELFLRLTEELDRPDVKFLIAGEIMETDPAFSARFREITTCNPRVRYLGYRTDPENIYATADVLIMPTQCEEACAMVLFETAAAKKPIIASRTGGTPEIIQDGMNGLLFDREDFDTLKRHTCWLLDHPEERLRLGNKAFEIVRNRFTDQPVRELERIYMEALNGNGSPAEGDEELTRLSGADFK
ncbi:glycosyltransferase family 4 protein [Aromatoleum toluolicum]|uniref:Glycosyltransferase n=1 Tax=Aromatoleum toluolicum TaxID=90060 RepID=A0ABX1NBT1_9RHOO|nr:glycosyltransferase family 4 protein [Aromatoleum toluolicum]NMF96731.1 glycosyltransferase family 4 protein [Aromatoleum toluolicum]